MSGSVAGDGGGVAAVGDEDANRSRGGGGEGGAHAVGETYGGADVQGIGEGYHLGLQGDAELVGCRGSSAPGWITENPAGGTPAGLKDLPVRNPRRQTEQGRRCPLNILWRKYAGFAPSGEAS